MSEAGVCALCGLRYGDPVNKLLKENERLRAKVNCDECWNKGFDAGRAVREREIEQLRAALQRIANEDNGVMGGIAWGALSE